MSTYKKSPKQQMATLNFLVHRLTKHISHGCLTRGLPVCVLRIATALVNFVHYKNYIIRIWLGVPLTAIFYVLPANQPTVMAVALY
jgi:hypothetical protein